MRKLLGANFMRLKKDKVFWICAAVMFAVGAFIAHKTSEDFPLEKVFFIYCIPLEIACAAFCSLFIGTEYSDGTIRNKIIVGQSRCAVYLSNFITSTVAGLVMAVAYMIPMFAIGVPRLGFFSFGAPLALALIGVTLALIVAVCALFTLVCMLCQNKALVAVLCLIGLLAMLFVSAWLNSRLQEPEMYDNYVYMDDSGVMAEAEAEPNPNYLRGAKRDVFQFFLEFLPTGQALMLTDLSTVTHIWQLPVYSLIIILLANGAGLWVFRRKDLK